MAAAGFRSSTATPADERPSVEPLERPQIPDLCSTPPRHRDEHGVPALRPSDREGTEHRDDRPLEGAVDVVGMDIRGAFHWTAVDNYEWLHGYEMSFGIIDMPHGSAIGVME